jgi:MinD-like ATPase involved in chromosome partitioning or flagellar assembly
MYSITFYSFKGGVGRSLALANVGAHLALTGRKVLLVDFDLEAPGLDTFSQLGPQKSTKGVIDYVYDYVQTGKAPNVEEYVYECPAFATHSGSLWMMPAGVRNQPTYARRLASIDWQKLYSEQNGYLLFEELKSQWEQLLNLDYVLVDSRTGYSDVAGICTRHLPDAAVVLFFPNDQNLGGLAEIVASIRDEATGPRKKKIRIHFVTSNIPDLDDEDQILARRIARFRRRLGYENLAAVIHHYPSLALLNQVIFTQERPRSRLAKEYQGLCRKILRQNLQDREGALSFLRTPRDPDSPDRDHDLDKALEEIARHHAADGEVLAHLGSVYSQLGRGDWALNRYQEAISIGFETGRLLVDRARLLLQNGQEESAIASAERVLVLPRALIFEVNSAVRLLLKLDPSKLQGLPESDAFKTLTPPERLSVAQELFENRLLLPIAERAIGQLAADLDLAERAIPLVLCLIGQGRFEEAMKTISSTTPEPATMAVEDAFNYGMAMWGATGKRPLQFFARVVECDAESRLEETLNRLQCGALAYWVTGNSKEARARLLEAYERIESRPQPDFSAWRYLRVAPREFRKDLDSMRAMFDGAVVAPDVLNLPSDKASRG